MIDFIIVFLICVAGIAGWEYTHPLTPRKKRGTIGITGRDEV